MKKSQVNRFLCGCLIAALGIVSGGCRPSVREVAAILYKVPLGSNRDELRRVLVEAYGKKYPDWKQSYALTDPPVKVTQQRIDGDVELISVYRRDHRYVRVYPADLFDKMPSGTLSDEVGLVKETADGNGFISIYYDSRTNYIGFLSCSSGYDH